LKVFLSAYPSNSLSRDIAVIDVHDAWGMLLYRKWTTNLGVTVQMNLYYETIPIFEVTLFTLYRHLAMRYQVKDPKKPMYELMCVDEEYNNLFVFL